MLRHVILLVAAGVTRVDADNACIKNTDITCKKCYDSKQNTQSESIACEATDGRKADATALNLGAGNAASQLGIFKTACCVATSSATTCAKNLELFAKCGANRVAKSSGTAGTWDQYDTKCCRAKTCGDQTTESLYSGESKKYDVNTAATESVNPSKCGIWDITKCYGARMMKGEKCPAGKKPLAKTAEVTKTVTTFATDCCEDETTVSTCKTLKTLGNFDKCPPGTKYGNNDTPAWSLNFVAKCCVALKCNDASITCVSDASTKKNNPEAITVKNGNDITAECCTPARCAAEFATVKCAGSKIIDITQEAVVAAGDKQNCCVDPASDKLSLSCKALSEYRNKYKAGTAPLYKCPKGKVFNSANQNKKSTVANFNNDCCSVQDNTCEYYAGQGETCTDPKKAVSTLVKRVVAYKDYPTKCCGATKTITGTITGLKYGGTLDTDKDKITIAAKKFIASIFPGDITEESVSVTVAAATIRARRLAETLFVISYEVVLLESEAKAVIGALDATKAAALVKTNLAGLNVFMKVEGATGAISGTAAATAAAEKPASSSSNALSAGLSFLTIAGAWLL